MSRIEKSLDHKRIRLLIWVVLTLSLLLGYSLQSVSGSAYRSMMIQNHATVSTPPVILQNGTAGTSTIYADKTSAKTSVEAPLFDYVDNNDADVDSNADKGMHSNFPAEQAGPDSTYDTLTEENAEAMEDYVDNNTSDVDNSGDKGTLSDFGNMKTKGGFATLTESSPDIIYVNEAEASATSGTSAQVNKPTGTAEDDFMIALLVSTIGFDSDGSTMSSVPSDWTHEHDYTQSATSGQHVYIYWKIAGASEPSSYTWTWTSSCGWVAQITTFRNVDATSPIHVEGTVNQESSSSPMSPSVTTTEDNCMIWLYDMCDDDDIPFGGGAPGGTTWIDRTEVTSPGDGVGISTAYFLQASAGATGDRDWTLSATEENSGQQYALRPAPADYQLDQEVQFTNVVDFLPTEKLCIYVGALGSEDLRVDYWNGTGWENLATDLFAYSCNEYIVSLTSTNFTIRFKDGTTGGDTTQDQWQIDASLLRVEGTGSKEDAVDNDTSNEDGSDDVGTLSNFDNMKTKDGMANLTEGEVGGGTVWLWQEDTSGYSSTSSFETYQFWSSWTTNSTTSGTITKIGIYVFANPGNSPQVKLGIYDDSGGNPNNLLGQTNAATITAVGWLDLDIVGGGVSISASTTYHIAHITDIAPTTQWRYYKIATPVSDYRGSRVWPNLFDPAGTTTKSGSYRYGAYRVGYDEPSDYRLDQEVQWTDVLYSLPNEELCIYGGTMGAEDIKVDVWNGSSWVNIIPDMNTSDWHNVTITSFLTSSTFTIRLKGGNETSDTTQDTWQIDVALIHVWSDGGESYELDLEVQWTNTDYTRTNEELCIKTGTFSGSEKIQVRVWNSTGSSWHWLMNLTASQWNNMSITSYLTSNTFTIQFLGGTETGDTSEDSWNIDATLLHVWTSQDNLDSVDNNTTDVDSSADKGMHSNFTAQEYLDGIYDTLTEADTSTSNTSDNNVDLETITHGASTGIGGAQTTDGTTENMTEGTIEKIGTDTSGTGNNLTLSFSHTLVPGTNRIVIVTIGIENGNTTDVDSVTYGDQTCTKAIDHVTGTTGFRFLVEIWYILDADLPSDGSQTVNVTCSGIIYELEVNAFCSEYAGVTQGAPEATDGANTISSPITNTISPSDNAWIISGVGAGNVGNWTHGEGQVEVLEFDDFSSTFAVAELRGASGETSLSSTYTGTPNRLCRACASWTEAPTYQLDIEHVVNSIGEYENYNLTTRAYRTAPENFYLQLYNFTSSQWVNMSTITASSLTWYNTSFAKTDFINSTNQARIRYWQEVDATQEILYVDYSGVYGWNVTTNYELDLEVQWTGADYTRTNEELCIKTGTFSGSEKIQVRVWNSTGSSWHWLMNLTASQWNNMSITSYLTSNTFTIQFLDGTETGDTSQDSWNIDATLLHVWTGISGWLDNWDKRVKITVDHNDVDEDLSDFPVLLHLSNSSGRTNNDLSFIFDEVGSNSAKIAVTTSDGTTQCYVEVEKWNTTSENAWLWVKVPSISNTTDTELYLYYDNDHADNTGYVGDTGSTTAQNVWDSNFKGVWHLSETSGGVGAIKDSTSNNNAGTANGNPAFGAAGMIDSAISFDGFDDYINMSNSASLQFTSSLTIEGWINLQSFGSGSDVDVVFRKGEGNPNDYQLAIHDQKLALMIEENDDAGLESAANLTATAWYYLAGTWNGSIRRVYLNASEDGSGSKTGNIIPDMRDIYIGGRSGTDLSTGDIDEIRASNTTRSAAWIKASYESGRDDLLDFGVGESEETSGSTYDYVLRVNNTVTDSWQIRLKKYADSNVSRLQDCTIYFHNSTDGNSNQIIIENGSYINQTGSWYDLGDSETIYIAMTGQANSLAISHVYAYLEIRTPTTSTYAQYVITFEVT